jgi:hypothetical protein
MPLNSSAERFGVDIMAEAIAAFGLAANIIQFIDSGRNLISTIWNIYRKGRDGLGEDFDSERTTKDLELVLASLRPDTTTEDNKSETEISFEKLAEECQTLANELLQKLLQITAVEQGHKRDALKTAFRLIWKEDEIKSHQQRLEGYKHQLNLHFLASLW